MDWLASIFGYVLNWLYNLVQNYGVAIILFSVLLKLIMLPLTYKQQKSMKKSQKVQEEVKNLQFKYKNDQEKLQKETMELYKREGVSPFSGCLSTILQLFIFIAVFYLVSKPLTFMKKVDQNKINDYTNKIVNEQVVDNTTVENKVEENKTENTTENKVENKEENKTENVTENKEENKTETNTTENKTEDNNQQQRRSNYQEIEVIEKYGATDEEVNVNMDFLGLNLTAVPMSNWQDFKVLILPILYLIVTFINMKYTNDLQKKGSKEKKERRAAELARRYEKLQTEIDKLEDGEEKEKKIKEFEKIKKADQESEEVEDGALGMTKGMSFMMPLMSIMISMIAPLGLSLYWLISNLLNLIERIVVNRIIDKQEEKK
jgi:YidC/Oxa1 family membrane protein insertase